MIVNFDVRPMLNSNKFRGIGRYVGGLWGELAREEQVSLVPLVGLVKGEWREVQYLLDYAYLRMCSPARVGLAHITEKYSVAHVGSLPTIITVYDLIPARMTPAERGRIGTVLWAMQERQIRRAVYVQAISRAARAEIIGRYDLDPSRVYVVYPGTSIHTLTPEAPSDTFLRWQEREPNFLLAVADQRFMDHRKRLDLVARVGNLLDMPVVFVGKRGDYTRYIAQQVSDSRYLSKCLFLDFIPDRQLAYVYRNARALVFPSSAEGFGIPLIEAQSVGCPVVAMDIPVVREVLGQEAVLLCDSDDDCIAAEKVDAAVRRWRPQPVVRFSWADSAHQLLDIYQRVIADAYSC